MIVANRVAPDQWSPVGVRELEPAADRAVKSLANTLVIAGPGAGKTELLAQRACYLLQTGLCEFPQRILAISFKKDAARNLKERVIERCGRNLARQFDSLTFDAFSKNLLDRFRSAIPQIWRPHGEYNLEFDLTEKKAGQWFEQISEKMGGPSQEELATLNPEVIYKDYFLGRPLSCVARKPVNASERIAFALWDFLFRGDQTVLNFQMIGRLAELLLRENPKILRALRATYGFVFLDEFQDTTGIQYDLTKTAFIGSNAIMSAVGDNKQRIMTWAGAQDTAFADYEKDFSAQVIRLENNYRSAPELVRIQKYLIDELDQNAVTPVAVDDGKKGEGECRILLFRNHNEEARYLAKLVDRLVVSDEIPPREICILTRNRPADYTQALRSALSEKGIEARIESELQDMLSEPVVTLLLHVFKMVNSAQAPHSRSALINFLLEVEGEDEEVVGRAVERRLSKFISDMKKIIIFGSKDEGTVSKVIHSALDFFNRGRLAYVYPQYGQGDLLVKTSDQLIKTLSNYLRSLDWIAAVDALEGSDSVPIMTMHKSKGLEYDTVIFVGLEDDALFSYVNKKTEETCGFFVAFSRAKKRVIFTFCDQRPKYAGGAARPQRRRAIGRLYELLENAGVEAEEVR